MKIPRHLSISAAIRVHRDISKARSKFSEACSRRDVRACSCTDRVYPAQRIKARVGVTARRPPPSGPAGTAVLGSAPVPDVSRSAEIQVARGSQQRGSELTHFRLPCHSSRLLPCLSRLEKRNQKSKPVLKAALSKRGKPAPPTSANRPAPRLFNSPPHTFARVCALSD